MLGTDLSSNILEQLVEQSSGIRSLVSCERDRLAQERATKTPIVNTSSKEQRVGVTPRRREGTHFPSKTQGLILEKSVSCESFGI